MKNTANANAVGPTNYRPENNYYEPQFLIVNNLRNVIAISGVKVKKVKMYF